MPTNVAVLYGFCEGKREGRKFNDALRQAGFVVVGNASTADIIIAHSGGCYLVPRTAKPKLVMFVGVSYWPGRSLPERLARKTTKDFALHWREHTTRAWLVKTFWNGVYFWRIPTDLKMLRGQKSNDNFAPESAKLILIRNKDDSSSSPDMHALLPRATFCELPGQHDDLWDNPK